MPKRVIDFDARWGSDKLTSCEEWAQAEYAWLYGLADASGCFELTNLRVIWGRVAAIRRNLSLERLEQIFHEFQDKGLLFVWEENGKRYGHWTGSDVPGRLPAPSWRVRLERLAQPVPKQQLVEFMPRFSRGRAASPGGGFLGDSLQGSPQGSLKRPVSAELHTSIEGLGAKAEPAPVEEILNESLEAAQGQDWKWNRKQDWDAVNPRVLGGWKQSASPDRATVGETSSQQPCLPNLNSRSEIPHPGPAKAPAVQPAMNQPARSVAASASVARPVSHPPSAETALRYRDKSSVLARELMVGQGPLCGPVRVKPEVLERIRARDRSRSP
jgi:hypothetical protein